MTWNLCHAIPTHTGLIVVLAQTADDEAIEVDGVCRKSDAGVLVFDYVLDGHAVQVAPSSVVAWRYKDSELPHPAASVGGGKFS